MDVALLKKISRIITRKPSAFDMTFLHVNAQGEPTDADCGTAHCICGWAAVLLGDKDIANGQRGYEAFGISKNQARRLFFVRGWPEKFRSAYRRAGTRTAMAGIAAERIAHFIETGGQ